jgi:DNA-binding CsgD family transcriptional regulator
VPRPLKELTRRQQEVLTLLAAGLTAAEIGECLDISARTARAHIEVLKQKLDVRRSRDIPAAFRGKTGLDPFVLTGLFELARMVGGG